MTRDDVGTGIDYPALIKRVHRDPTARQYALLHLKEITPTIFQGRDERNAVRVSDAGACALERFAAFHGLLDLADDYDIIDDRMEAGTLDGWRTAALIQAGIRQFCWPLSSKAEIAIDCDGVPGHADVAVYAEPDAEEIVEAKLTFWPHEIDAPHEQHRYWLWQACKYAMGVGAKAFVILVHAPAIRYAPRRVQFRYATEDWVEETNTEYARLARALGTDPPLPDAAEKWRCKSCRYSKCDRNINPLNPKLKVVA